MFSFANIVRFLPFFLVEPVFPINLECSPTKQTKLCLVQGYSTFDLPMQHKANQVKIGGKVSNWKYFLIFCLLGFEISDVLAINDKDYTITFALYFSAEWLEPRLNLSKDLWGEHLVEKDDDLVPGEYFDL